MNINHVVTPQEVGATNQYNMFDVLLEKGNKEGAYKVSAAKYVADKRWQVETGGIVRNGSLIATDRVTQSMITGAQNYLAMYPEHTIAYKTPSGFIQLDLATITAIGTMVAQHVQACFVKEKDVLQAIANGTITSAAQVDSAGWPS